MSNIKNIIFDLGNVLLNIDYNKTVEAFEKLGFDDFKTGFSPNNMGDLFKKLETGSISEATFYQSIKDISKRPLNNTDIKNAWNALLLNFRTESLVFLEKMAKTHKLYLLSNTNSIHLTAFNQIFIRDTGKPSLDAYFTKTYYSNIIGLRKPDEEVYVYVLKDAAVNAAETLFIDDLAINTEAAKQLGIQTHLLLQHQTVENINL